MKWREKKRWYAPSTLSCATQLIIFNFLLSDLSSQDIKTPSVTKYTSRYIGEKWRRGELSREEERITSRLNSVQPFIMRRIASFFGSDESTKSFFIFLFFLFYPSHHHYPPSSDLLSSFLLIPHHNISYCDHDDISSNPFSSEPLPPFSSFEKRRMCDNSFGVSLIITILNWHSLRWLLLFLGKDEKVFLTSSSSSCFSILTREMRISPHLIITRQKFYCSLLKEERGRDGKDQRDEEKRGQFTFSPS